MIDNTGGDEDDHDVASIAVAAASAGGDAPDTLAFTGSELARTMLFALALVTLGMGLLLVTRRRRDDLRHD